MNSLNILFSISILMLYTQAGQVDALFSLPEKPFFHDKIVIECGAICYIEP